MATTVTTMKMALASEEDLGAAYELLGLLDSIDRGYYPAGDEEEDAPMFLDEDDPEHLRRIYTRLKEILGLRGSGAMHRVIGGFSTLRYEKNQFLDLTKDTVELHPRIIKALELEAAMRDKSAPPAIAALPPFPVSLRKMWSGGDVQRWIDDNIKPLVQERHFDAHCGPDEAPSAAKVPQGWKLVCVNQHFSSLMDALERADDKGYLPDAMRIAWEEFEYDENIDAADGVQLDQQAAMEAGWAKTYGEPWYGGNGVARGIWEEAWQQGAGWMESRAAVSPATAEPCAHDYVRSDRVCTECGEKTATADGRHDFMAEAGDRCADEIRALAASPAADPVSVPRVVLTELVEDVEEYAGRHCFRELEQQARTASIARAREILAAPVSTWPGYRRGFSDGRRAADRIHAQRVAPGADTEQLAEARKLIAHACEFAMVQLDDEWHERAAALLALPAPDISASAGGKS